MGKAEDIVMRNYEAFRAGDVDKVLEGWASDGLLVPLGRARIYRGHDELRRYLEKDIYEFPEFDFRVYTVLDQDHLALTFGRYSVRDGDTVVDHGVFCISEASGDKLVSWEAYENVGEAFAEFRRRLAAPVEGK
jgi:limonene-1,2-epoxide hydrolase